MGTARGPHISDVDVEDIQEASLERETERDGQAVKMRCFRPPRKFPRYEEDKLSPGREGFRYELCRIMRPDDANIAGNVHGGNILKMIEEAGCIVSTRHCNTQNEDRCMAALVRVEKTEFLYPLFIGEVAHATAEITFTSQHSLEVQVKVIAENILTGAKKLVNRAVLWYVPCSLQNVDKVMEVPPIKYDSGEQEEEGRKRYEAQKTERLKTKERIEEVVPPPSKPGVTMKLMDEVAGIVAARHCNTNIVTASVDAINFHRKIQKGCIVTVTGRLTFVSNKSMEIEVLVDACSLVDAEKVSYRAVSAFFTFISLDRFGKAQPVPPLKVSGEEEQRRYDEGQTRYLHNKAKRLAEKEGKQ
uniref:cytosolic acyl coenzyme A thioester hydrolase isoform X4 n=1 Tax=Doryrhamphus excisus TaxID=161450 RepID=UPI0025AE8A5E|nr:cytosolic acyl coenzyme A thioester hydrolase isoform X4 [Doryrhamphus excisus]